MKRQIWKHQIREAGSVSTLNLSEDVLHKVSAANEKNRSFIRLSESPSDFPLSLSEEFNPLPPSRKEKVHAAVWRPICQKLQYHVMQMRLPQFWCHTGKNSARVEFFFFTTYVTAAKSTFPLCLSKIQFYFHNTAVTTPFPI